MNTGQLHRYELVERIAVGGMAEVFKAKTFGPHGFEKVLAVKRILPSLASDREFVDRFIAEAKIAATLSHANIVQVLDFSRFGESLYIAMEFVDGVDLATVLRGFRERRQQIPVAAALHIALGLLGGLGAAHKQGVVHRDVSPSNVLLSRSGDVKITDFGIAKAAEGGSGHTQPFKIMGKWRYMSPEQARGDVLDARSDIFSAAVVLYEVFTGERLFDGLSAEDIVREINAPHIPSLHAVRPDLPEALDGVLARALQRDVAARKVTCEELASAIVDISYASSLPATSMELGRVVQEFLDEAPVKPETSETGSGELIDQIINSELARHGDKRVTRITMATGPVGVSAPLEPTATTNLSFVSAGADPDGFTRWTLVGGEGEHFDDLLQELIEQTDEAMTIDADARVSEEVTALRHPSGPAKVLAPTQPIVPEPSRHRLVGVSILMGALVLVAVFVFWLVRGGAGGPSMADAQPMATRFADAAQLVFEEPDAAIDAAAPAPVRVTSTPSGASIAVAGAATGLTTPSDVAVAEPRAETPIIVRLEGYLDCEVRARPDPVAGRDTAHCDLQEVGVTLVVRSEPSGAEVVLDGRSLGETPLETTVPATGEVARLRLKKAGRDDETATVTLAAGQRVEVSRRFGVPYGTIDLFVKPWANIYWKGKKLGEAPRRGLRLPHGTHRLRLVNPVTKREKTITVTVPSSQPYHVELPAK